MASLFRLPLRTALAGVLALAVLVGGCEFLDPTEVENPRTTDANLAEADAPVASLLPGLRAQFARALGAAVVGVAFGSDDYSINGTGVGGTDLDSPRDVEPATSVINATGGTGMYWNLQELRALADFVIDDLAPGDETATDAALAEAHYYRALAYLMQGENFVAVPVEADGEPLPAGELLARAAADLDRTLALAGGSGEFHVRALAAYARTHRALGNAAETRDFAERALAAGGPDFLFVRDFDVTLGNVMQDFLVDRSIQEAQPLPRLDFLDPKYLHDESAIPVAKAEEMHLLLAEAALLAGDEAEAREQLAAAVRIAEDRPVVSFDDSDERLDNALNPRPRSAEIQIRADANSPFVSGLVRTRPGTVDVPTISATSVSTDLVEAASGEELLRLLYLARQEILFLEARRLHDLGIRYPMMEREIETNPNIAPGDLGTTGLVPAYIPENNTIDLYEPLELYADGALVTDQVTMLVDMNRVLARERGTVLAAPLLPTQ